ncbi:Replicative DNA helicase [bioreactor metagenome]|uniref:Replicative DNA helicase n=1 Tax=bioreactor metagenome TaxID=1076179 RepID=A0A645EJK7_9ZZZZ
MLSDLRESGSLEQDADVVIFLYRDAYYNPDAENKDILENIVAKNRNGQVGIARLKWKPEYQKVI